MDIREKTILRDGWHFTDNETAPLPSENAEAWQTVRLPHTWNAHDGQDGGADYKRTKCRYYTEIYLPSKRKDRRWYLRFGAAQYDCTVTLNGKEVGRHKGGYSAFVFDITDTLEKGMNRLLVSVSNAPVTDIYPQMADFTFYGGLHREVSLFCIPETHFDLEYHSGAGITVSADVRGQSATLHLDAFVKSPIDGDTVRYSLLDGEGRAVIESYRDASEPKMDIELERVHLWQGINDPYLYEVRAQILRKNEVVDEVSTGFGFRSFSVDPEKGFFLNGKSYPLRGVSRHQDKLGKGNALFLEDHVLDANMIREVGANTVRLAHYQQSEEFYGLCDRYGFIVWAEIPFISKMSSDPAAHENAISQMKELLVQNYNHPSICFWGISNEITIGGSGEQLVSNLKELNELCHKLDPSRLTTMAQVSPLPIEDEQNLITDAVAYNHYFGWYGGELADNEKWLDSFHSSHPQRPIGISEYGCEGIISYHSDAPKAGDYSEEYQAVYHEHMLKTFEARPYIWGTYVWNMFDFGCDARDEGGVKGRNNKGLVTFDRKIKKDAFYLYKAYWKDASLEPVIHICGKRYAKRASESITLKVYSNLPSVKLLVNGELFAEKNAEKVFVFENVPLKKDINIISAVAGEMNDTACFEKVDKKPEYYELHEEADGAVANWFDDKQSKETPKLTFNEGYYSVKDTLKEILLNDEAGNALAGAFSSLSGMRVKKTMLMMMAEQTPEEMFSSGLSQMKDKESAEKMLAFLNADLQKIAKCKPSDDKK